MSKLMDTNKCQISGHIVFTVHCSSWSLRTWRGRCNINCKAFGVLPNRKKCLVISSNQSMVEYESFEKLQLEISGEKKSLLMQWVFLLIFSAISAMWLQKLNLLSMVTPSSLNLLIIVILISLLTWMLLILMTSIRLWLINGYKSLTNFCQDDLMTPFYEDQYYFFEFGYTFIDCWLRDDLTASFLTGPSFFIFNLFKGFSWSFDFHHRFVTFFMLFTDAFFTGFFFAAFFEMTSSPSSSSSSSSDEISTLAFADNFAPIFLFAAEAAVTFTGILAS